MRLCRVFQLLRPNQWLTLLLISVLAPFAQNSLATGPSATWITPPYDLSATGEDAEDPQVALSSDGTRATAVWTRWNGSIYIIQSASATISGGVAIWGSTSDLTATGQGALNPQVALSSDGTKATAVWFNYNGGNYIIESRSATISGAVATWGSVENLSVTGQSAYEPQVALSSDGTKATAVWYRWNGSNFIIQSRSADISGTSAVWGSVGDLSATGQNAIHPQVALSSDGTKATAIWRRSDGSYVIIQSASATVSASSGTWSTVVDLSVTGESAYEPQVALSSDGTKATAIWRRWNGSNFIIQSRSAGISAAVATWGTVVDLSATGGDAYRPQVALSIDGTKATAVWYRNYIIQSASATISSAVATWGSIENITAAGRDAFNPQVALSSDGTKATAVWYRSNGSNNIIQSASATISGAVATWGSVTDLSETGQNANVAQVALSSDGTKATAIWRRNNGSNGIIQSSSANVAYSSISPSTQTVNGVVGSAITATTAFTPSGFGGTVSYGINPSLPANLSLDSTSGVISGTPTTAQSSTNYTVTATGSTSGSATSTVSITIAQGSQTISFGTAPTPIYSPGGTFPVSATATSNLPVTYTSLTTGVCTVSGSTVTIVTAGGCTIAANQAGNSNWLAAPQQTQNIAIAQASQATFTASGSPSTINVGGSSNISATGGSGTGTVSYSLVFGSPCTLLGSTLTAVGQGICTVTVTKASDTNYLLASSTAIVNVNLAPQSTLTVVPSSTSINVNGTATLSTTGGDGNGAVTYAVTGPCSLNGPTLTGTGAGNCSVTATKAADSAYDSTTSSPVVITVSGPPPVINLVATPGPGYIRLDFSTVTTSIAASTSQIRTNSVVTYTGTCDSINGGVTASSTGTSSPLRVTGVTAGKTYTCTVTGTDGSGSSTSAPSNVVVPAPAPTPPNPIPTLSEWAQILMMLMMVGSVGWYSRKMTR